MFKMTGFVDFGPFSLHMKIYEMIGRTINGHSEKP